MVKNKLYRVFVITILGLGLFVPGGFTEQALAVQLQEVRVPSAPIPEGDDFSTAAFEDAWDMSEYSDISQYINGAGRHPSLTSINIQDGIFSATSIGSRFNNVAAIYPLFPGYPGFMDLGNLGVNFPIDSQKYQCMYIAMKVDSPASQPEGMDGFRVLWYTDESLSPYGAPPNGGTLPVYTHMGSNLRPWKLYKVDLRTQPGVGVNWVNTSGWQGLVINPTLYANTQFKVDWIRLTGCSEDQRYLATINWEPDRNITALWVRPVGAGHEILVKSGIDGSKGGFNFNTQGLAPGEYQIGVGTEAGATHWSAGELSINAKPRVDIIRPSPVSGEEYAEEGGNSWDIDASDITGIDCASFTFENGLLKLETQPPALLPSGCKGPEIGEADPRIFLSMPKGLPVGRDYRYLSFRMFMNGEIPIPADGMIARWIWTTLEDCTMVSADIPLEPGWHTYTVDLYSPLNGKPVSASGCSPTHWSQIGQIRRFRFDPNENWTGNLVPSQVFRQELDWIRLTKVDRVAKGMTFPIQLAANDSASEIKSTEFYYTSDLRDPYQHRASLSTQTGNSLPPPAIGDSFGLGSTNNIFLPAVMTQYRSDAISFNWDTSGVNPGEYYICVKASNGISESTNCSKAPVLVFSP